MQHGAKRRNWMLHQMRILVKGHHIIGSQMIKACGHGVLQRRELHLYVEPIKSVMTVREGGKRGETGKS